MKAQAYELGALPKRLNKPVVYQFNLLSVVDSDLIRLYFDGDSIETQPVNDEHYIARYIIKKQATFSRIRFMRADAFGALLSEYSALHQENCRWFDGQCGEFYLDIVKDSKRAEILIDDFRKEVRRTISWALMLKKLPVPDKDELSF